MKKTLLAIAVSVFFIPLFAIKPVHRTDRIRADQVLIPINKQGQVVSLADLAVMKVKDYEQLTGRHLNLVQHFAFRAVQHKLQNSINPDGTLNNKRFQKFFHGKVDELSGFHLGGFALGFLLGLIGVLIAYLINDGKKHQRVKWAWIGLIAWVAIVLIFALR